MFTERAETQLHHDFIKSKPSSLVFSLQWLIKVARGQKHAASHTRIKIRHYDRITLSVWSMSIINTTLDIWTYKYLPTIMSALFYWHKNDLSSNNSTRKKLDKTEQFNMHSSETSFNFPPMIDALRTVESSVFVSSFLLSLNFICPFLNFLPN